jgi:hypothetical protein
MSCCADDCPKFGLCSANVCPLDADWRRHVHLRGERVCLWLREWSKVGGIAHIRERLLPEQAEAVGVVHSALTRVDARLQHGHRELRRVLRASSQTGSKLAQGHRLLEGNGSRGMP